MLTRLFKWSSFLRYPKTTEWTKFKIPFARERERLFTYALPTCKQLEKHNQNCPRYHIVIILPHQNLVSSKNLHPKPNNSYEVEFLRPFWTLTIVLNVINQIKWPWTLDFDTLVGVSGKKPRNKLHRIKKSQRKCWRVITNSNKTQSPWYCMGTWYLVIIEKLRN